MVFVEHTTIRGEQLLVTYRQPPLIGVIDCRIATERSNIHLLRTTPNVYASLNLALPHLDIGGEPSWVIRCLAGRDAQR